MRSGYMKLGFMLDGAGRTAADWAHPDMPPHPGTNFERYKQQTLTAERAKADLVFIADTLWADADTSPHRMDRFESMTVLSALAAVTKNIGLIGTISSTFTEPYNVARLVLSLDHLSGGRAGWNLVTSDPKATIGNFGRTTAISHEERFKVAQEYVDVIAGLWDSFEDDALVQDKKTGTFLAPGKLHSLNHKGKYFDVKGPLNMHRSAQGRPVIFTATGSEDGKAFAARHAEAVFTTSVGIEHNQKLYSDIKSMAKACGRDPSQVLIMPNAYLVVGDSQEEAEALQLDLANRVGVVGALQYVRSNFFPKHDLSQLPLDEPFPVRLLEENNEGFQSHIHRMIKAVTEQNLTTRQFALRFGVSNGNFTGSAEYIADNMQAWLEQGACDGFVAYETLPGHFNRFVDKVVPILQRRGLLRTEYEGTTLRENLGLEKPMNRYLKAPELKSA